jgi:molecular chaperone GrpE
MSDAPQPETPAAETELDLLRAQVAELKDRQLRMQAEFDNVRKRLRREADEAGTRAVARAFRPLLDQIDNLERALGAATPETFAEFAQGVSMIRDGLVGGLTAAGLSRIVTDGVFDPAVHEALAEEERADLPKGTITGVHRAGWMVKDQLVRAAQVVVAKPAAAMASTPPAAT